jgi:hypothetical protein
MSESRDFAAYVPTDETLADENGEPFDVIVGSWDAAGRYSATHNVYDCGCRRTPAGEPISLCDEHGNAVGSRDLS